jgi:hypothetical protein
MVCGILDLLGGRHNLVESRSDAKDHRRRVGVVTLERVDHLADRRDRECAGDSGSEIIVGSVEKHPRVTDAIGAQIAIREGSLADVRVEQALEVIVMPRHALTFLS